MDSFMQLLITVCTCRNLIRFKFISFLDVQISIWKVSWWQPRERTCRRKTCLCRHGNYQNWKLPRLDSFATDVKTCLLFPQKGFELLRLRCKNDLMDWQFLTASDGFWQILTVSDRFWQFLIVWGLLTVYDSFW